MINLNFPSVNNYYKKVISDPGNYQTGPTTVQFKSAKGQFNYPTVESDYNRK